MNDTVQRRRIGARASLNYYDTLQDRYARRQAVLDGLTIILLSSYSVNHLLQHFEPLVIEVLTKGWELFGLLVAVSSLLHAPGRKAERCKFQSDHWKARLAYWESVADDVTPDVQAQLADLNYPNPEVPKDEKLLATTIEAASRLECLPGHGNATSGSTPRLLLLHPRLLLR